MDSSKRKSSYLRSLSMESMGSGKKIAPVDSRSSYDFPSGSAEDGVVASKPNKQEEGVDDASACRRRKLCTASICLCFAIVGVIAFGIAFAIIKRKQSSEQEESPTLDPNSDLTNATLSATPDQAAPRDVLGFLQRIADEFGAEYLEDTSSLQYQAFDWIVNKDPMQVDLHADNLIQRFVLASFYLQTASIAKGLWKSCNPPQGTQRDVCYHFYLVDGNNEPWRYQEMIWNRWVSGLHECQWAGIKCHEDKTIRDIELNGYNLVGQLPTELAKLESLTQIALTHNSLTGSIPAEIGTLANLINLELQKNELTGSLPVEFFQATSLIHVNLASNRLNGTMPNEIQQLSNLDFLFLQDNELSGPLTPELMGLDTLEWLFLGGNRFSGTIPTELGGLTNLVFFYAEANPLLSGTLPSEMGLLTAMKEMDLHGNKLRGTIPKEIFQGMGKSLNVIDLSRNQLSGSLSTHMGSLSTIDWILFNDNQLTGSIPAELALLTTLRRLELQGNGLTGSVSSEVCHNALGTLVADCAALSKGEIPIACPCCTVCCSQETGACAPF